MTFGEITSHSMPFLNAICSQVNRIRIIEAGGNPDKTEDDEGNIPYSRSHKDYDEVESGLSDADFYGQLNALMK